MAKKFWFFWALALICSACGGGQVIEVDSGPPGRQGEPPAAPAPTLTGDKQLLQEWANRSVVREEEVISLSNRMLQEDIARGLDGESLALLEKALLKALPQTGRGDSQALIQRNLGIVHFYKREYNKARQALQSANETNPRDARTHFYLACIYHQLAKQYQQKGQVTKAKRAQNRAKIEIETARRLEPGNPLYRKNPSILGD